jgi:hypothetical protein
MVAVAEAAVTIEFSFKSRAGRLITGTYLFCTAAAFLAHLYSVNTNPADSGESALPFFSFNTPMGHDVAEIAFIFFGLALSCLPCGRAVDPVQ